MKATWTIVTDPTRGTALSRRRCAEIINLPIELFDQRLHPSQNLVSAFGTIAEHLTKKPPSALRSHVLLITVQTESRNTDAWNPLLSFSPSSGRLLPREVLLSWLVLAFPEVRILGVTDGTPESDNPELLAGHLLPITWYPDAGSSAWIAVDVPAIFDFSGLRNTIKQRAFKEQGFGTRWRPANRQTPAATIDEEYAYAHFNALAVYRLGYRAAAVTNADAMKCLFRVEASAALGEAPPAQEEALSTHGKVPSAEGYGLVFEDLYLNFPDRDEIFPRMVDGEEFHLSSLRQRDGQCPKLRTTDRRVLVTVGHHRGAKGARIWRDNVAYLRSLGQRFRIVLKPIAGLHRLWRDSGLWSNASNRPRYPEGFLWPPSKRSAAAQDTAHSAPGRLLELSTLLIDRARRTLAEGSSVEDLTQAAVLALEAKEMLAGQTPTTALEALAVQHEAEVSAESAFLGIEYNIALADRFKEIEQEVNAISRWFARKHRKRSALNVRLTIIERLAMRFQGLNQIEEEMACLAEARKLRFDFWVRENWLRWPFWPLLRYLAFTLHSLPRFALVVAAWAVFFGLSYYVAGTLSGKDPTTFWDAMISAWKVSFTGGSVKEWAELRPGTSWNTFWTLWLTFQGLISSTNLALLFSHLYLVVNRR